MAIEVRIPTILLTFTGGEKAVHGDGSTLLALIDDVDAKHPGLKARLVESDNLRRFVADNLASGVDHMVVFLDAPGAAGQAEARAHLEAHPHVTLVCCDRSWWHGDRPERLNVRQRINANVALALFDKVEEVDWVVHVDGDEVVDVDPDALVAVVREAGAPVVVETPGGVDGQAADLVWLRTRLAAA